MAKSKTRSKQADLRDKLAKAKQEKVTVSGTASLTAQEIKEQNDRLRFEQLLRSKGGAVLNDFSKDGYLSPQQEDEVIQAKSKCHIASMTKRVIGVLPSTVVIAGLHTHHCSVTSFGYRANL